MIRRFLRESPTDPRWIHTRLTWDDGTIKGPNEIGDEETMGVQENLDSFYSHIHEILDGLGLPKLQFSFLDIGTGTGALVKRFLQDGYKIMGVDGRPRAFDNTLPIVKSRVEDMSFCPDNSIDVALSSSLFDGIIYRQNRKAMLTEISKILSPGGLYIAYEDYSPRDIQPPGSFELDIYEEGGEGGDLRVFCKKRKNK